MRERGSLVRSRSARAALVGTVALVGLMAGAPILADGEAGGCYWTSAWDYDSSSETWYEYWYEVCEPDPPPPPEEPPPPDPPPPDPPPPPPPPDPVYGCTDPNATNYDPNATANDGGCHYPPPPPPPPVFGCTDPNATNYTPDATADDGSCSYPPSPPPPPPVSGCTDSSATNYNPTATADDGTCTYAPAEQNTSLSVESTQGGVGNNWLTVYGDASMKCIAEFSSTGRFVSLVVTIHGPESGPITVGGSAYQHIKLTATLPSVWNESPNDFECEAQYTAGTFAHVDRRFFSSSRYWGSYGMTSFFPGAINYGPHNSCSHASMVSELLMNQTAPGYPNLAEPAKSHG